MVNCLRLISLSSSSGGNLFRYSFRSDSIPVRTLCARTSANWSCFNSWTPRRFCELQSRVQDRSTREMRRNDDKIALPDSGVSSSRISHSLRLEPIIIRCSCKRSTFYTLVKAGPSLQFRIHVITISSGFNISMSQALWKRLKSQTKTVTDHRCKVA